MIMNGSCDVYGIVVFNKILGRIILFTDLDDKDLADGKDVCYFANLWVHPRLRGHKLGSKLINHVTKVAKKQGFKYLTLGVHLNNEKNVNIYKHLGFDFFRKTKTQDVVVKDRNDNYKTVKKYNILKKEIWRGNTMNYPNPFIPERADPYVTKAPDGSYYFTASYPAFMNVNSGYDRIILRKSETVIGLATAEEITIWNSHNEGVMSKHIWAPELHFIGGKWYVFFAAGEQENEWNIRPFVLMCSGKDPINDEWLEMGKMQASDGDSRSFNDFSLDMTYFENNGKHYVVWAERIDDSSILMAEIDENEPWKLKSQPIMLTKPEYDWEKVRFRVNEGPAVLKTEDKVYVFFSASGTGEEYCVGKVYADKKADLMDVNSWTKSPEPALQTNDLVDEAGPGHNSFVVDENGNQLIVYHARPFSHFEKKCGTYCDEPLYDPCRHARIKLVTFDKKGEPILK